MKITKYETNYRKKLYFNQTELKTVRIPKRMENQIINVYPELTYQKILGFGGAITESAGYAFSKLPPQKKIELLNEYYSENGNHYSIVRVPIGSCDFSIKSYSHSSKRNLSDFNIKKDKEYIIPLLKRVFEINPYITLFASPWSPPWFMKNTRLTFLGGKLRFSYKQKWADYITKFIQEYNKEKLDINYITIQNEPNAIQPWESCLYDAKHEANFAIKYLYPTLKKNHIDTKILIWDHNKDKLYSRAKEEFSICGSNEAISGVAFHYYTGDHFENLKLFHDLYPNKLLVHTEGCTGFSHFKPEDEIPNAELYAHEIIGDLNSGTNGYIDWNIMLDHNGGPNHKNNFCNSPIMLNEDSSDYIKNLSFYYIGHFSRFIQINAKRIAYSKYTDKLELTSFKNPDSSISIVIFNKSDSNVDYNLCIQDKYIHDTIDSHSILTLKIQ